MLYVIEQLQLSRYVAAAGPKTDAMAEPPWRVYKKKKIMPPTHYENHCFESKDSNPERNPDRKGIFPELAN